MNSSTHQSGVADGDDDGDNEEKKPSTIFPSGEDDDVASN